MSEFITDNYWTPPRRTIRMQKVNANCSFKFGPKKWTSNEQKKLLSSQKFSIRTEFKKGGGGSVYYVLGDEEGNWDFLKDFFVDQLLNHYGDQN